MHFVCSQNPRAEAIRPLETQLHAVLTLWRGAICVKLTIASCCPLKHLDDTVIRWCDPKLFH